MSTVFRKSAILLIFEAEITGSLLGFLSYTESTIGPIVVGPEGKQICKTKVIRSLENAILSVVSANTAFH